MFVNTVDMHSSFLLSSTSLKGQLPVLMIGSGPSSLALAQGLLTSRIPFHIFESDLSVPAFNQKGDINLDCAGYFALQHVLPFELWNLLRSASNVARHFEGHHSVDRTALNSVLLYGLYGHISFGKEFASYEIWNEVVLVRFTDGTYQTGSMIIGGDGSDSEVRKQ